jgi:glyceraldehyde-3-phosphate dehydrogenase (NAD(P))
VATPKKKLKKAQLWEMANEHARIMPVRLEDGFLGNASMFRWARDMGYPRGDMYEIALWEESIVESGDDLMFAINIPQESVVIPENIDAIRAAMKLQITRDEGTAATNKYLGMK